MSKVFIIGGTGFISSQLTKKLLESGHDVTLYTRGTNNDLFSKSGVKFIKGDRRDTDTLRKAASEDNYDVVYDMIAYHPKDSLQAVSIFGGRVDRFIHCSTISVYMISDDLQCPITEDQWTKPLMEYFPRNPFGMDYGINKRECEKVLCDAYNRGKLQVSMIRPTYISGPNDQAIRDFFWIERILDGGPLLVPGSGDCAFQNVYVDDVAKAFHDLLNFDETIGQAYNVTSEEIFSLNDYIRLLSDMLGKKPKLFHLDQKIFDSLPISYNPNGDVFTYNVRRTSVFSLDKAKRDFGYHSTPYRKWMQETIDWYLNEFKGHSYGYEKRQEEFEIIDQIKNIQIHIEQKS